MPRDRSVSPRRSEERRQQERDNRNAANSGLIRAGAQAEQSSMRSIFEQLCDEDPPLVEVHDGLISQPIATYQDNTASDEYVCEDVCEDIWGPMGEPVIELQPVPPPGEPDAQPSENATLRVQANYTRAATFGYTSTGASTDPQSPSSWYLINTSWSAAPQMRPSPFIPAKKRSQDEVLADYLKGTGLRIKAERVPCPLPEECKLSKGQRERYLWFRVRLKRHYIEHRVQWDNNGNLRARVPYPCKKFATIYLFGTEGRIKAYHNNKVPDQASLRYIFSRIQDVINTASSYPSWEYAHNLAETDIKRFLYMTSLAARRRYHVLVGYEYYHNLVNMTLTSRG